MRIGVKCAKNMLLEFCELSFCVGLKAALKSYSIACFHLPTTTRKTQLKGPLSKTKSWFYTWRDDYEEINMVTRNTHPTIFFNLTFFWWSPQQFMHVRNTHRFRVLSSVGASSPAGHSMCKVLWNTDVMGFKIKQHAIFVFLTQPGIRTLHPFLSCYVAHILLLPDANHKRVCLILNYSIT